MKSFRPSARWSGLHGLSRPPGRSGERDGAYVRIEEVSPGRHPECVADELSALVQRGVELACYVQGCPQHGSDHGPEQCLVAPDEADARVVCDGSSGRVLHMHMCKVLTVLHERRKQVYCIFNELVCELSARSLYCYATVESDGEPEGSGTRSIFKPDILSRRLRWVSTSRSVSYQCRSICAPSVVPDSARKLSVTHAHHTAIRMSEYMWSGFWPCPGCVALVLSLWARHIVSLGSA